MSKWKEISSRVVNVFERGHMHTNILERMVGSSVVHTIGPLWSDWLSQMCPDVNSRQNAIGGPIEEVK